MIVDLSSGSFFEFPGKETNLKELGEGGSEDFQYNPTWVSSVTPLPKYSFSPHHSQNDRFILGVGNGRTGALHCVTQGRKMQMIMQDTVELIDPSTVGIDNKNKTLALGAAHAVSYKCVVIVLIWNPSKVQYTPIVTGSISLTGNRPQIQQHPAIVHPVATLCFPSPVKTLAASTICTRSFLVVGCDQPPAVFLFRLETLQIANETEGSRKKITSALTWNYQTGMITWTSLECSGMIHSLMPMHVVEEEQISQTNQDQTFSELSEKSSLEASVHSSVENSIDKTPTPHPTLAWIDFVDRKLTFGTVDQRRVILRNIKDLPSLPLAISHIPTMHCIAVLCREYPQYPYLNKIKNSDDEFETKDFFNEDGKDQNDTKQQKPRYDKMKNIDYENYQSVIGLGLDVSAIVGSDSQMFMPFHEIFHNFFQYFHESIPERDVKGDLFIDIAADWYIESHSKHFKDYRPKRLPPYKYNAPKITLCYSHKTQFCVSYPHSLSTLNVIKALENQNPRFSITQKQYMYMANNELQLIKDITYEHASAYWIIRFISYEFRFWER
ncbi:MAG: hypothetical protein EZS28_003219 [Streblomastix strix]|uniref:Uncharacterized protein n=1 Tax=Streblomastix strix TaxID=222440 RepID=A0A5J4X3C4_9EUKA|nr:MAG: hypothetical protein EZS28_003219 [Streblomastix strix]